MHDSIDLITTARVSAVSPDKVTFTKKTPEGKTETFEIPTNFVLWSTGIAMNPFTQRVSDLLPNQVHKKAIEVDAHLRVKGAPLGEVYAIGDASTVRGCDSCVLVAGEEELIWVGGWGLTDRDVGRESPARARRRGGQEQGRQDRLRGVGGHGYAPAVSAPRHTLTVSRLQSSASRSGSRWPRTSS